VHVALRRSPIDPLLFRRGLSYLPTGVTVITGYSGGRPVGLAYNSFASVSPDPPLVSFCPARTSDTWPGLRAAGRFCANFMAEHHEGLTRGRYGLFADAGNSSAVHGHNDLAESQGEGSLHWA